MTFGNICTGNIKLMTVHPYKFQNCKVEYLKVLVKTLVEKLLLFYDKEDRFSECPNYRPHPLDIFLMGFQPAAEWLKP